MDNKHILSHVDHTLLKPTATWQEICTLCEEAITHQTASVCIPPSYIQRVAEKYGQALTICTVIGFPLGYATTETKLAETKVALCDGATEIDMVINLGDVKNKAFERITEEIQILKQAVGDHILKVIVETCYLTADEKIKLCQCVSEGGADYIKTSTGFGTGGATPADVALFQKYLAPHVKIKASGGIRTREDMQTFLTHGCDRLGTSSAVKILIEDETNADY